MHQSLCSRQSRETYVDNIVEEAVLRNSSYSGSVVGACVDRRHSVDSSSEAVRNISTEDAVDGGGVQTLEEREGERVEDLGRVNSLHLLNNNAAGSDAQFSISIRCECEDVLLGVCDQDAPVELLRCSKVAGKVMSE